MSQGLLWIVEPPLSTGERMSVNDPLQPVDLQESRRSPATKQTLTALVRAAPT